MADLGKLWFELGIKGDIAKELEKYTKIFGDLDKVISNINSNLDKNGNDMLAAFNKISQSRIALNKVMKNASKDEQEKMQKSIAYLNEVETHLVQLSNDASKMGEKGIVSSFLKSEKFGPTIQSIQNFTSSLAAAKREELSFATNSEKLSSAIAKVENKIASLNAITNLRIADKATLDEAESAIKSLTESLQKLRNAEASKSTDSATLANIQAKVNKAMQEGADVERKFGQQVSLNRKTVEDYANAFGKLRESAGGANRYVSELTNQIMNYTSLYGLERLAKTMITIGGEFEKQHVALKSMLGDAREANEIFSQIKALAPISPFTFRDLTSYAKQLTAFNIPFDELYDTTKRLSDISAGLGVDMSRIILAYGQVRSASVLRGQELRQFTEAGIPIVQALADKLTKMNGKLVTTGEVFDYISKRKVPFEMVKEVLWDLTEEGGRFYNMQMVLSDTLAGKWANLQDSWEIMLSTMANSQSTMGSFLKNIVSMTTTLINNLNRFAPMLGVGGLLGFLGAAGQSGLTSAFKPAHNLIEQLKRAKALQAEQIELNVAAANQTALQKQILATKRLITSQDIAIMTAEGKITAFEAIQLTRGRDINRQALYRELREKGIERSLAKQIASQNALGLGLSKIKDFLKANAGFLALSALGASIGYIWNESKQASENAAEAANSAAQRFSNLKRVLDDTFKVNTSNKEDLKTQINGIEEALKEVDPYLETFKKAHDKEDMETYYKSLRRELELTTNAYKDFSQSKDAYQDIIEGREGTTIFGKKLYNPFKDNINSNIKDWNESRGEIQSIIQQTALSDVQAVEGYLEELAKTLPKFREAIYKNGVSGEKRSFYDQLNYLIGDKASEENARNNYNTLVNFVDDMKVGQALKWRIQDFGDAFSSLRSDYATMVSQTEKAIEQTKEKLIKDGVIKEGDVELITDTYKTAMRIALTSIKSAWTSAGEDFNKTFSYIANQTANVFIPLKPGETPEGSNNNNNGTGSTDEALKRWKEEFDELKKFYSQYSKWAKIVGDDEALKKLQEDGLFSGMFEDGKPIYDIKSWEKALDKFMSKINGNTLERKKFQTSVKVEKLDFNYDQMKKELDNNAKRISEYLSDEIAKYGLFEKIFEKTGDKSFAMNAFSNGRMWTDATRGMAEKLAEMLKTEVSNIDFDADSISMEKALEGTQGAFEIWKKIVDLTRDEYNRSLENAADATEKLMNYEEKIAKLRAQRAELERKGASNAELIAIDKEIMKQQTEQFENSTDYLRFYSAILSMTTDEAERIGTSIRENLVKQLADGNINADKYLKSMRNITQQIDKARGGLLGNSDFATFVNGGQKGLVDKRWEEMASAAIKVQKAEEDFMKAQEKGSEAEILSAKVRLNIAQQELNAAKKALNISEKQYQQLSDISMIADVIMGALSGMQSVAKAVSDMFDALGNENAANTWSDIADGIGIVTDTLKPLDGILKNFMSGNISGMVSNALLAPVNLITAPITGIAKLHDKKLDRAIQQSQFEVKKLQTAYEDLEKSIRGRLGGIYGGSEYTKMLENLRMQRTELQRQMEAEDAKKKTDKEKMEDYRKSINEMDEEIRNFAADMAKSLYDIDVKSWAQQLTDAVVSAWAKGEDAAQAFHDKVKDIIKDLAVNILTQKVMESALQPIFDEIVAEMERKSGKLDEESIDRFASALDARVEQAVPAITSMLEQLKARGWDISESSSTSSSSGLSKGIQGTTEETSNLLASYINAVRADVSVIRMVLETAYGTGEGSMIAQAQLQQLQMIASSTARNADATERIESIFNAVTIGNKHIYIQ